MTDAELKAYLKTLTASQFQQMLNAAGAGTGGDFVDYNRAKLLSKYSAASGEGRAIRDAYELIDEGVDPVDVAQRVIAAQSDYNISGDSLNEITGAIGDYGANLAKFQQTNKPKTNVEVLKDLGMTELAPLLGSLGQTPKPVGLKSETGDVSFQRALEKATTKAAEIEAKQKEVSQPGSAKYQPTGDIGTFVNALGNVPAFTMIGGPLGYLYALGKGKKDVQKSRMDTKGGDLADSPYTKAQFQEMQKLSQQKMEQEHQKSLAEQGLRYQQSMNKAYNDAYMKEFARLQAQAANKPTAFDVQRAAMLRALNG